MILDHLFSLRAATNKKQQKKKKLSAILDIHYNWMQSGNDGIKTCSVAERLLSCVLHDWDPITSVFETGRKLIRSHLTGNVPQFF